MLDLVGSSGPSEMRNASVSALITSDCSVISAPIGRCAVANHDDSAGLSRTLCNDAHALDQALTRIALP